MDNLAKKYETEKQGNLIHIIRDNTKIKKSESKIRRKKEVYPYEVDDLKKMLDYFQQKNKWIHFLLLTFGCNTARRIGDILQLKWVNIYDPYTGNFRDDMLDIVEQKTDKLSNPKINNAIKDAVKLYIERTGCRPEGNNYNNYIFIQLQSTQGGQQGKVITEDGHLKALKRAAKNIGITYNIGTHSARKFFGKMNRQLHPDDYDSMELLQIIYNHSDANTTKRYIGLTKEKVDKYYNDMGDFFTNCVIGNNDLVRHEVKDNKIDKSILKKIIEEAYLRGMQNSNIKDMDFHNIEIKDMLENLL